MLRILSRTASAAFRESFPRLPTKLIQLILMLITLRASSGQGRCYPAVCSHTWDEILFEEQHEQHTTTPGLRHTDLHCCTLSVSLQIVAMDRKQWRQ